MRQRFLTRAAKSTGMLLTDMGKSGRTGWFGGGNQEVRYL